MSSETIKKIYLNAKTKEVDYITPILFICIVCSAFGYLYTNTQNKLLHLTWNNQKCNPKYVFFSGFLNPLYKDPWKSTATNFNRCVATSMYKDAELSKNIKRNQRYIKKHNQEIQQNLSESREGIEDIRNKWEDLKEKLDMDVRKLKSEAGGIFEKQGTIHNVFAEKMTQMFKVVQSVAIYIQGILLFRISHHKEKLDMVQRHNNYMASYANTYNKYKQAFTYLDQKNWNGSINTARDAIAEFDALTRDLKEFMEANEHRISDINKSCYHLKNDLDDKSCTNLFPNLLDTVEYQPILTNIQRDL